jgi:hypothetical protein
LFICSFLGLFFSSQLDLHLLFSLLQWNRFLLLLYWDFNLSSLHSGLRLFLFILILLLLLLGLVNSCQSLFLSYRVFISHCNDPLLLCLFLLFFFFLYFLLLLCPRCSPSDAFLLLHIILHLIEGLLDVIDLFFLLVIHITNELQSAFFFI